MLRTRQGLLALSPIVVFLISYVVVSILLGDFYKMPVSVALLLASVWGVVMMHKEPLGRRIEIYSKAAGNVNILYMIWIFVLAGAFATLARSIGSVEATVNLTLSVCPSGLILPALFFAACFISLSIGTSVGTVVALVPLAVEIGAMEGDAVSLFVAAVLGGAFFGDNLSFISDTTIAATRSQGCSMADKFKANSWIVIPAAVVTLAIYSAIGWNLDVTPAAGDADFLLIVPYLLVIILAVSGLNVTVVLTSGILSALAAGSFRGHGMIEMAGFCGEGIESMGGLIIVTLMAAGMLGLINAAGGITYLLDVMTRHIKGRRGAQAVMSLLVASVNVCTANNTVAIITVGDISRSIAERYGVDPRKSASLLDTSSCIVQSLIPYGAQTLLASSLAGLSAAAFIPHLYYTWVLTLSLVLSIVFLYPRRLNKRS